MFPTRASSRLARGIQILPNLGRSYATTSYSTPAPNPSRITDQDVHAARGYCSGLLQYVNLPIGPGFGSHNVENSILLHILSKPSYHLQLEMHTSPSEL